MRKTKKAVVGLDGFVDEIVYVVDKRFHADGYSRIKTIGEYAERIAEGAGVSTNVEIVSVRRKIGGNGPIFAQGLKDLGIDLTYIGSIGEGRLHPVFEDLGKNAETWCLAQPAETDAMEFEDGKIIRSKLTSLNDVRWERMVEQIGTENMAEIYDGADLIGFNNWTMIMHMNGIWEGFFREIVPRMKSRLSEKTVFLDLADPRKRTGEDILEALRWIRKFGAAGFYTILGLNKKEAAEILEVIAQKGGGPREINLKDTALRIAEYLEIPCVTIHPVDRAVCCKEGSYYEEAGPYCKRPVLTTGAGDAYNAGFAYGILCGLSPTECLKFGMAASGYYVRNGRTAAEKELLEFMDRWLSGALSAEEESE